MKDSYCADQGRCSCYKKTAGFCDKAASLDLCHHPSLRCGEHPNPNLEMSSAALDIPTEQNCSSARPSNLKLGGVVAKEGLACGGLGHRASAQRSTMPSWRKASRNSLATCYDDDSGGTTPTPWPLATLALLQAGSFNSDHKAR